MDSSAGVKLFLKNVCTGRVFQIPVVPARLGKKAYPNPVDILVDCSSDCVDIESEIEFCTDDGRVEFVSGLVDNSLSFVMSRRPFVMRINIWMMQDTRINFITYDFAGKVLLSYKARFRLT